MIVTPAPPTPVRPPTGDGTEPQAMPTPPQTSGAEDMTVTLSPALTQEAPAPLMLQSLRIESMRSQLIRQGFGMGLPSEVTTVQLTEANMGEVAKMYAVAHEAAYGAIRERFKGLVQDGIAPEIAVLELSVQKLTEDGALMPGAEKIDEETMEAIKKAVGAHHPTERRGRPAARGQEDFGKGGKNEERSRSRETTASTSTNAADKQ